MSYLKIKSFVQTQRAEHKSRTNRACPLWDTSPKQTKFVEVVLPKLETKVCDVGSEAQYKIATTFSKL